ncbi:metal-dependent hydrolase family protein [Siminovitchia fortis]|uniref:metal-dependent hydrolase family protein n=1 Tax=Siminovitchia fortis TaxID=254758 RepID=UPI001FD17F90|nr:amidohydrolase family protein [Siminovitchia fortis]
MGTVITNVRIVGAEEFSVIENGMVRFDNTGIRSVGKHLEMTREDEVVDGKGATLLPGLIDCHIHLGMDASPDPFKQIEEDDDATLALRAVKQASQFLANGITTVRNVGSKNNIDISFREAVKKGLVSGPNIVASGMPIVMTGGHCHVMAIEADGLYEVQKAARAQIKAQADLLKIMATGGVLTKGTDPGASQYELEEIKCACQEAHKASLTVAAHAIGLEGVKNAIKGGVTTIEHGGYLDDEAVQLMVEKGTYLVPTLIAARLLLKPENKGAPQYMIDKVTSYVDHHKKSFQKALNKGVKIVAGTDAGTPFNYPGYLADELELMVAAGMSKLEALKSATYTAACSMNIEDQVGRIKEGLRADFILVDGNPLDSVKALKNIVKVYQNGQVVVNYENLHPEKVGINV